MLDLVAILDRNTDDLARSLAEIPDPYALLRRLRSILRGDTTMAPWFPVVPMERFLHATATIEGHMLARMGWEVEPDPVVRAKARSRLRRALTQLARQYAAAMDREQATLQSRLRRRLQASQHLIDAILANTSDIALCLDASGRILRASATLANLSGRPADETTGAPVTTVLPWLKPHLQAHLEEDRSPTETTRVLEHRIEAPAERGNAGTFWMRLIRLPGPTESSSPTWLLLLHPTDTRRPMP